MSYGYKVGTIDVIWPKAGTIDVIWPKAGTIDVIWIQSWHNRCHITTGPQHCIAKWSDICWQYLQLNPINDAAKQPNHSKEFIAVEVPYHKLLSNIGDAIKSGSGQAQHVPQNFVGTCVKIKRIMGILEALRNLTRSCQPFWKWCLIYANGCKNIEEMTSFTLIIVPADDLILPGAWTSPGTVMSKFVFHI